MEDIIGPLVGGVIIGIATSLMLLTTGRITGISGIVGQTLGKINSEHFWRYAFIAGLILGGFIIKTLFPEFFNYELKFSYIEAIIAGGLVGFGTQLGSGCTSGHGVCGLARFSKRSLIATLIFMGTGILTVLIKGLL